MLQNWNWKMHINYDEWQSLALDEARELVDEIGEDLKKANALNKELQRRIDTAAGMLYSIVDCDELPGGAQESLQNVHDLLIDGNG